MLAASGAAGLVIFYLAYLVFVVIMWWMVFQKAGRPGWAAIIPIYNLYTLCKVAKRPGWWWVLFLIPVVNIVVAIIVMIDLASAFGKSGAFAVGLIFLNVIFAAILALGPATYDPTGADLPATT